MFGRHISCIPKKSFSLWDIGYSELSALLCRGTQCQITECKSFIQSDKFPWKVVIKKCSLGKFLASSNLNVKSQLKICSTLLHTFWLQPSKTALSSVSSSTPPLGHVKSCILRVLHNLLVKNAVILGGSKLLLFVRSKASMPTSS